MKEILAAMKVTIAHQNAAMEECTDLLAIGDSVYTVGRTRDGFATWAVSVHDGSSHWGHYGFPTREEALVDVVERTGVAK